jgi:hypothetical protein
MKPYGLKLHNELNHVGDTARCQGDVRARLWAVRCKAVNDAG